MKIAIGSDHAGFAYKEKIKALLQTLGHEVRDFGTHSPEPVDYPLFIRPVAQAVARGEFERGIVLGEVSSSSDVQEWVSRRDANTLLAGGAEFFGARRSSFQVRQGPARRPWPLILPSGAPAGASAAFCSRLKSHLSN